MPHPIPLTKQVLALAICLLIVFALAALGAMGSIKAPTFYASLYQPTWAPPAWLFGPVWTLLYALMGIAAWLVWRESTGPHQRTAFIWFGLQLILNALWSWWFFAWQQGFYALINIVLLWIAIVITMRLFWRIKPLAGALLIPYLMWVTFATALNWAMWRLNPAILSGGL